MGNYRRRGVLRRWWPFAVLFVALWAYHAADRRVAAAGPFPAFIPHDAYVTLAASDFPAFWRAMERTGTWHTAVDAGVNPAYRAELHLRETTGVRPTASRWHNWLGPRLAWAKSPDGTGLCARPGLLLRAAARVHGWWTEQDAEGQVARYGPYHFAWRDGALIVSASTAFVEAALAAPPREGLAASPDRHRITLRTQFPAEATLELAATNGLPVSGVAAIPLGERVGPLTLPTAWPDSAAVHLTAATPVALREALAAATALAARIPGLEPYVGDGLAFWDPWQGPLEAAGADEVSAAVWRVRRLEEAGVVPDFAILVQPAVDFDGQGPTVLDALPWGTAVSTAPELVGLLKVPDGAVDGVAHLDIRWPAVGTAISEALGGDLAVYFAEAPGEYHAEWLALAAALQRMGHLTLTAEPVDGGVRLSGHLDAMP